MAWGKYAFGEARAEAETQPLVLVIIAPPKKSVAFGRGSPDI